MSVDEQYGVVFPQSAEGRRSTAAVGRAVVADALRATDPAGARSAEQETNWRSGYLPHFRRLVEAGLDTRAAALGIASDGLASVHARMRVLDGSGAEGELRDWRAVRRVRDGRGPWRRGAGARADSAVPRQPAPR